MRGPIALIGFCASLSMAAELQEETDIKFAIYSSAWGENTQDRIRLIAFNQHGDPIRLDSIHFLKTGDSATQLTLNLGLTIPAGGYGEAELGYVDLLQHNQCIERSMADNWKLVEISNYTLNPSVRNLIIQDTDSFRIYQCIENVITTWTDLMSGSQSSYDEWVLYHFETRTE